MLFAAGRWVWPADSAMWTPAIVYERSPSSASNPSHWSSPVADRPTQPGMSLIEGRGASRGLPPPTDDNCPLRHRRVNLYIGLVTPCEGTPSFPRRREPRIPAPRRRWEMERNGTKRNRIKSSPLLATPDEAHQGHNEVTVAPCLRVNGEQRGHAGLVSCLAARSESGQIGPNRPTVWGVSTPDHS